MNINTAKLAISSALLSILTSCAHFPAAITPTEEVANEVQEQSAQPLIDDPDCYLEQSTQSDYLGPDYASVWNRIRAGFVLQGHQQRRIDKHLAWYKKHPEYLARVSKRAEPFLYYITSELDRRNMPMELALLPVVESAFDPFAYSHGRAAGMWQFIPATGRQYGLKQNWWYDGRRDPLAATNAALDFLSYLNRQFDGDWLLALAAYNSGEGNVRKAIRRNKKSGKPTDFWHLRLPRETRAYVPQLLALSEVVLNAEGYSTKLHPIANRPYFDVVNTGSQIDLAQAASLAGISTDEIYRLNAGFNRWATDPKGPHRLLIPVSNASKLRQQLSSLDSNQRISWERYKVKSGDSLISIAKKFGTSVEVLKSNNNIEGSKIRAGHMMLIPRSSLPMDQYTHSADQRLTRIKSGGQSTKSSNKTVHRVKPGDSFWSIGKKYGVGVRQLAKWNGMAPGDTLKQGTNLVIWSKKAVAITAARNGQSTPVIRKVSYRVRQGDSLARIAGKFNLRVSDIVNWNKVNPQGYIHPGQSLTLFVNVTQ